MKPYGCHSREPFDSEHLVQDGWTEDGQRIMRLVPFRLERECNYTTTELGKRDERCAGCCHRQQPE